MDLLCQMDHRGIAVLVHLVDLCFYYLLYFIFRYESVTALTYSCPLSGYVMVCYFQSDQLVRQLHLVDLQKSWNDAQQYCRDEYIDLAIVNSSALIQEAQKWAGSTEVWIGLSKSSWKWSRLSPFQSSWFPPWSPGQPGTGECVTISSNGSCEKSA
uniref:C-type lectin domain-containing protein n=1 Tax=Maylandia zebra TaxID=106582 RepID=A0A3P9BNJ5_9CICH